MGGGASLISVVSNLAQMITGPFGVSAIILAIAGTFIAAALHFLPGRAGFVSMGCGAVAFAAAWLVNTYLAV